MAQPKEAGRGGGLEACAGGAQRRHTLFSKGPGKLNNTWLYACSLKQYYLNSYQSLYNQGLGPFEYKKILKIFINGHVSRMQAAADPKLANRPTSQTIYWDNLSEWALAVFGCSRWGGGGGLRPDGPAGATGGARLLGMKKKGRFITGGVPVTK